MGDTNTFTLCWRGGGQKVTNLGISHYLAPAPLSELARRSLEEIVSFCEPCQLWIETSLPVGLLIYMFYISSAIERRLKGGWASHNLLLVVMKPKVQDDDV